MHYITENTYLHLQVGWCKDNNGLNISIIFLGGVLQSTFPSQDLRTEMPHHCLDAWDTNSVQKMRCISHMLSARHSERNGVAEPLRRVGQFAHALQAFQAFSTLGEMADTQSWQKVKFVSSVPNEVVEKQTLLNPCLQME